MPFLGHFEPFMEVSQRCFELLVVISANHPSMPTGGRGVYGDFFGEGRQLLEEVEMDDSGTVPFSFEVLNGLLHTQAIVRT